MEISPIRPDDANIYEGSSDPHPESTVLEAVYQVQEGFFKDFTAWLTANPNNTSDEVTKEFNTLSQKYGNQLSAALQQLRNEGYGPTIDGMKPSPYDDFYQYTGKIQGEINYNGPTEPGNIPAPTAPNGQISADEEAVQDAISKIQGEINAFNSQLTAAQTAYKDAQAAYAAALAEVNKYSGPNKAAAQADLQKAAQALATAQKALSTILTDPNLKLLNQQLAAADAALKTFPTTDVAKANAAALAAQTAETNAASESSALNTTLAGITSSITSATTNIQAAVNEVNPTPNTPVEDYDKLVIDGVTCVKLPNGLIFPSGGLQGWGTSEGMGNWMRDAWKNGDKKLFQALLNSYFHVCRESSGGHMGLMPWSIDKSGNIVGDSSATDADEDIISTLLDAVAQDPNMTMTDTDGKTMKVSDMLKTAISNFVQLDCGTANGLTGGSTKWELGPGFTDYFDPTALTKMMNYCKNNGMAAQAATLNTSMQQMMQYVQNELKANNGLPASGGDGSCALSRLLYRLTDYYCSPLSADNPQMQGQALTIVQDLLTKGFSSGAIQIASSKFGGTTIHVTTPGSYTLANAQASAPVYMAMMLLQSKGKLPPALASQLPAVKAAFENDMKNQFTNLQNESPSTYSSNGDYFGLTLGILCESLMQEYGS